MIGTLLGLGLFALAVPVLVACGYLLVLSLCSLPLRTPTPPNPPTLKFDVVIPAHNEAVGIAQTVKNLLAVDYPAALRTVVVVADNCSDDTAQRAREAGAEVLERQDANLRGKGYALKHAFEQRLAAGFADAICVVDADTLVTPNLLHAYGARLAAGEVAAQAHYGVQNPNASWRTRLMRIALAMFHQVRSSARERLGVSCGLRGNGMCFSTKLLREVPHDAFSIVEDLEYGVRLGKLGHRVAYVHEADVLGEMVSGEQASRSQRRRWEHGRAEIAKTHGWPLLAQALKQRNGLLFDLAMDVLVPPLAKLTLMALGGVAAATALVSFTGEGWLALRAFSFSTLCIGVYVFAGWLHSRTGLRGLVDLAMAPAYVAWKVALRFQKPKANKPQEWVRTQREGERR